VIGVEHVLQRLHVGRGAGVPLGKDDLFLLGQLPGAGRVEEQHAVARARPRCEVLLPRPSHVEKCVRRRELRDLDSLVGQSDKVGDVEDHG
jgi:hypothetical protein